MRRWRRFGIRATAMTFWIPERGCRRPSEPLCSNALGAFDPTPLNLSFVLRPVATAVDTYLNSIGKYRLLTADEEIALGRKIQRMMALKEERRPLTPEEQKVVKAGERAANRMVQCNLRLVVMAAKKYHRVVKHLDLMDLVQEGNIGLIRGVEKFDPTRGYKFSTYAYWWIRQAMTRAISTKERVMRLPGKIADMATNWNRATRELGQQLGRMPTIDELAERFGVEPADVRLFMVRAMQIPASLDAHTQNGEGSMLVELISDPHDPDGTDAMEQALMSEYSDFLRIAVQFLDDREKQMLIMRWGLDGNPPQSYMEMSKTFYVSRERVRQLLESTYRKIRYKLNTSDVFNTKSLQQLPNETKARFWAA